MDLGRAAYEGHVRWRAWLLHDPEDPCHNPNHLWPNTNLPSAVGTYLATAIAWVDLSDAERQSWAYVARAVGRVKAGMQDNYAPVGRWEEWKELWVCR